MEATSHILHKQNKIHHNKALLNQAIASPWIMHHGKTLLQSNHWEGRLKTLALSEIAPQGLALQYKVAQLLMDWDKFGFPTMTGRDWTLEKIQAVINRGPHQSALETEAIAHFKEEVRNKVAEGQAHDVLWDDNKKNHPPQFKVSPVAVIPQKLRTYRLILDTRPVVCPMPGRQRRD